MEQLNQNAIVSKYAGCDIEYNGNNLIIRNGAEQMVISNPTDEILNLIGILRVND